MQAAYRYVTVLSLKDHGQLPWWNPWFCGGFPAWGYAEAATNLVSPFGVLYALFPFPLALRLEAVAATIAGVLTTYLLAGRFTSSPGWRAFVAAIVMLSSRWALQVSSGHMWHLAYAWMPTRALLLRSLGTRAEGGVRGRRRRCDGAHDLRRRGLPVPAHRAAARRVRAGPRARRPRASPARVSGGRRARGAGAVGAEAVSGPGHARALPPQHRHPRAHDAVRSLGDADRSQPVVRGASAATHQLLLGLVGVGHVHRRRGRRRAGLGTVHRPPARRGGLAARRPALRAARARAIDLAGGPRAPRLSLAAHPIAAAVPRRALPRPRPGGRPRGPLAAVRRRAPMGRARAARPGVPLRLRPGPGRAPGDRRAVSAGDPEGRTGRILHAGRAPAVRVRQARDRGAPPARALRLASEGRLPDDARERGAHSLLRRAPGGAQHGARKRSAGLSWARVPHERQGRCSGAELGPERRHDRGRGRHAGRHPRLRHELRPRLARRR